jgi:hypothetical protein
MPESGEQPQPLRSHVARFEEGPRDGTMAVVPALESGEPPEMLLTPGRPDWVYVLAGAPRHDGSLPYLHMSPTKAAATRRIGRLATRPTASRRAR